MAATGVGVDAEGVGVERDRGDIKVHATVLTGDRRLEGGRSPRAEWNLGLANLKCGVDDVNGREMDWQGSRGQQ